MKTPSPKFAELPHVRAERLSPAKLKKIAREGGKARARKLSAEKLSEIAKKAVAVRERKRAQQRKGND